MSVTFISDDALNQFNQDIYNEYLKKIESVGIPPEWAPYLSPQEVKELLGYTNTGAIQLDYYDIFSRKLKPFKRYRLIVPPQVTALHHRYHQPKGADNELFVPPQVDEAALLDDETPLVITEGELKTLAATARNLLCVGLPGIDNLRSSITGKLFRELSSLPRGKPVVIVFDKEVKKYDESGKPVQGAYEAVKAATERLAAVLKIHQLEVYTVELPGEGKVQLDDYLNLHESDELLSLAKVWAPRQGRGGGLYYLIATQVIMQGKVYNPETENTLGVAAFKDQYGHLTNEEGKSLGQGFITSKYALRCEGKIYEPRCKSAVDDGYWNMYNGWGTKPRSGDISLMEEIWSTIFSEEPELLNEYHKTVAMLLQRPWVKQQRYLLAKGHVQGTGKSFLLEMPACLINGSPYGTYNGKFRHALIANAGKLLENRFNGLLLGTSYLVMNETGPRHKELTHYVKALVTDSTLQIEAKYSETRAVNNYLLLAISTNEEMVLDIDSTSRRDLVLPWVEPNSEHCKAVMSMWTRLKASGTIDKEYRSQRLREALMAFYLEYDLKDYTGYEPPLRGRSKMIAELGNVSEVEEVAMDQLSTSSGYAPAVVIRIELDRLNMKYPHLRARRNQLKAAIDNAGYLLPAFDKTFGQLRFNRVENLQAYSGILVGDRVSVNVLVQPKYINASPKEIMDLLEQRYGGKV